jgi:hypothetical protein
MINKHTCELKLTAEKDNALNVVVLNLLFAIAARLRKDFVVDVEVTKSFFEYLVLFSVGAIRLLTLADKVNSLSILSLHVLFSFTTRAYLSSTTYQ